jgi:hypothetical protein
MREISVGLAEDAAQREGLRLGVDAALGGRTSKEGISDLGGL